MAATIRKGMIITSDTPMDYLKRNLKPKVLIIHGYAGACLFFDVIGDTVYKVLETGSTTDVASIAEMNGKRVVVRTDLSHAGRKSYRIMEFDPL